MRRRNLIATAALAPGLVTVAAGAQALPASHPSAGVLNDLLRPHLAADGMPALAAAVVRGGNIVAAGAVGTRRVGADAPVTIDDRFHIGSDTKAMTSLLLATFVEQGALSWDRTLGAIFPELASTMDPGLRGVTVQQLLSHTSGLPGDNDAFLQLLLQSFGLDEMNLDEMRYWLLQQVGKRPLANPPGTTFVYSNLGYTLAGAIAERVGHATWEELIVARVFDPLGLATAGFGTPSSLGRTDQPMGHVIRADGTFKAMLGGPSSDNPQILGPAGVVHLSILDFAAWAGWHAAEGRRGPALVRPETLRKLHTKVIEIPPPPNAPPGTPAVGGYALGWGIAQPSYAKSPLLLHTGSNGMNLAQIVIDPGRDFAAVVATNIGGKRADAGLGVVCGELYSRYAAAL